MREKITKVIKVNKTSSSWYSNTTSTTISMKINNENNDKLPVGRLSMDKISGPDLTLGQLSVVLLNDFDMLKNVLNYLKRAEYPAYKRIENFFIEVQEDTSGCKDYILYSAGTNTNVCRKKHEICRLHISCFGKVDLSQIDNIWIGDLVQILLKEDKNWFLSELRTKLSSSKSSIKKIRRKLGIRYIKPIQIENHLSFNDIFENLFELTDIDNFYMKLIFDKEDEIKEYKRESKFNWTSTKVEKKSEK